MRKIRGGKVWELSHCGTLSVHSFVYVHFIVFYIVNDSSFSAILIWLLTSKKNISFLFYSYALLTTTAPLRSFLYSYLCSTIVGDGIQSCYFLLSVTSHTVMHRQMEGWRHKAAEIAAHSIPIYCLQKSLFAECWEITRLFCLAISMLRTQQNYYIGFTKFFFHLRV